MRKNILSAPAVVIACLLAIGTTPLVASAEKTFLDGSASVGKISENSNPLPTTANTASTSTNSGSTRLANVASYGETVTFTATVSVGSSGAQVQALQTFLINNGYLPAGSNTGSFGPTTAAAVKKFQVVSGLSATGTVGPATRAKLNALIHTSGTTTRTTTTTSMSLPTDCGAQQLLPMISIDASGNVIMRAAVNALSLSTPTWQFTVMPWQSTYNVNASRAHGGGSFSDPSLFVAGDIIDITGYMDGSNGGTGVNGIIDFPGAHVLYARTLRDKTAYCKTPVLHGVGTAGAPLQTTGQ